MSSIKIVPEGTPIKIALLVPQLDNFYTQADIRGVEDIAGGANATVQTFNANFDPAAQAQQCLDAISTGYQAIIVQAVVGTALTQCATKAISSGIAVVAIENALGPDLNTYKPQIAGLAGSILADGKSDGVAAANAIVRACEGTNPCKVAQLIGVEGFGFDAARDAVISAQLKSHPEISIVSRTATNFQINDSITATRDILSAHPDINVIETAADQMSNGAQKVLDQAGRSDVKIVSHGYSKEGLAAVRSGSNFSNGVMLPYTTGSEGAKVAIATLRGQTLADNDRFFNPVIKFGPDGGVIYKDTKFDHDPEYSIFQ